MPFLHVFKYSCKIHAKKVKNARKGKNTKKDAQKRGVYEFARIKMNVVKCLAKTRVLDCKGECGRNKMA